MSDRFVDSSRWKDYSGSLRAVLDEYGRALSTFEYVLLGAPPDRFVARTELSDEQFQTPRDILKHMINAGHNYNNYIEDAIDGVDRGARPREFDFESPQSAMRSLWSAFDRMVEVLGKIRDYDDLQQAGIKFTTRWGSQYDVEQMLEHAIVHVLRHRRQLERWLALPEMQ